MKLLEDKFKLPMPSIRNTFKNINTIAIQYAMSILLHKRRLENHQPLPQIQDPPLAEPKVIYEKRPLLTTMSSWPDTSTLHKTHPILINPYLDPFYVLLASFVASFYLLLVTCDYSVYSRKGEVVLYFYSYVPWT
jgi:hypothetical protein